ncbi:MAG: LytTR family DNA-binding domain-containing protein [Blautia sp.]|nr:LytTR family DNA-binding domain-containing protein [Lachnoclostridium sp.]MCM1210536.1 LytTR family DNA-binding domain-containing protein [Blautia sp.]
MKIAICDDEKAVREILGSQVLKHCPTAALSFYQSGEELLAADGQPDILFLDILMPGEDGMETARKFRSRNKKAILIFVTAAEEYVFQAFDVGAFQYLVKPFTDDKFASILQRAVEECREASRKTTQVSENDSASEENERCFLVKTGGTCVRIPFADIVYAEVLNRKVTIHTMQEDVEYYGRLSELEKQAGDNFFRVHRAYLVHFKYVARYNASTVWLEKGSALMAKSKFPEFVKKYLAYNRKRGNG